MKKIISITLICLFVLMVAGCNTATEDDFAESNKITEEDPLVAEEDFDAEEDSDTGIVKELVSEAIENLYFIVTGETGGEPFEFEGREYRYLDKSVDTKDKLEDYLKDYFTKDFITTIIDEIGILEQEKRMARPDIEVVPLPDISNAEITLESEEDDEKIYNFISPIPNNDRESSLIEVRLKLVNGNWLIDDVMFKITYIMSEEDTDDSCPSG